MSLHPKNFKGVLGKVNDFLKLNGHQNVHATSLTLEEPNDDNCTHFEEFPETRIDPVTGKRYIVIVKKCVSWG